MKKWKPFAVVTSLGKAVSTDMMEKYAKSKQLPKDVFAKKDYSNLNLVEPLYNPLSLAQLLEINTYHSRACRTKSEDVAGNNWRLSPLTENANEQQKEIIEDFIESQPETLENTFKKLQLDKELIGYFAMEIGREGNAFKGKVNRIFHLPAHTVRIHKSGELFCQSRNNKKAWFRNFNYEKDVSREDGKEHKGGTLTKDARGNEIIWSINYTPRSCFYGIPDVMPAIGAISGDVSRRNYNISFFSSYGVPAYMVSVTGDFDPGEKDPNTGDYKVVTDIQEKFKKLAENPQSVLLLTLPSVEGSQGKVDVKFQPISTEVKDASFRMYRTDNRDEVIAAHGIPPYRMGVYETGSLAGNLGRESTLIYYQSIIQPRQNVFNQIMNYQILPTLFETDLEWWFELESIDLTEIDNDVDRIIKLINTGVMTPNEAIKYCGAYFGLQEQDNPAMDFHYLNGRPIDGDGLIPESDIYELFQSVKDKLIEGFISYVSETDSRQVDRDKRITKAIADIQKELGTVKRGIGSIQETAEADKTKE